jgi:predicted ArsR family transcriptional regulator
MRQHKPTSKAGETHITPFKQSHKEKILAAIQKNRVGCTHEQAAEICGLRPDQVWKRLSELAADGKIYDTGITRKLKSGVNGIVWQSKEEAEEKNEKEELQVWWDGYQKEKPIPALNTAQQLSLYETQFR